MNRPDQASPFTYRTVGVLGGMGPLATVDFLRKLVMSTSAGCDQEHIPMLVRFCPEVPDRVDGLTGNGPSPLPELLAAAQWLEGSGAQGLVMPCNTAHAWYDSLCSAVSIPFLHIVDATISTLPTRNTAIGLLATTGTLRAGIYQSRSGPEFNWLTPSDSEQEQCVMAGVRAIKAQRVAEGTRLIRMAADALIHRGATAIIMGCTEIPLALANQEVAVPLIDPTLALAQACVVWAGDSRVASPA